MSTSGPASTKKKVLRKIGREEDYVLKSLQNIEKIESSIASVVYSYGSQKHRMNILGFVSNLKNKLSLISCPL